MDRVGGFTDVERLIIIIKKLRTVIGQFTYLIMTYLLGTITGLDLYVRHAVVTHF